MGPHGTNSSMGPHGTNAGIGRSVITLLGFFYAVKLFSVSHICAPPRGQLMAKIPRLSPPGCPLTHAYFSERLNGRIKGAQCAHVRGVGHRDLVSAW